MTAYQARLATPFAVLGIRTVGDALAQVDFLPLAESALDPADRTAERACRELQAYLADPDFRFTVPLVPVGTEFRRRVWRALCEIPAGQTRTYGDLAEALGSAARALGQACGANPIPVIIPCHRVVARVGLGGFMNAAQGDPLAIKTWLLRHEGVLPRELL